MRKEIKMKSTNEKTIKDGFREFLIYCRVKNLSAITLEFYENSFIRFSKFYEEDNLIKDINKQIIDEFILELKNDNVSSITVNTHLNGIRVMLYYFMRLGYLDRFQIPSVKQDKKLKETYTEQEIEILLNKPNINSCQFTEYRDWVIINTFLGTGMRIRTLVNLKVEDVDLQNQLLKYGITKNRRQQIVPISRTLNIVLQEYIEIRKAELSDWLFCSRYGEKLTTNALQHSLKKYNQRRGVIKTGCHLWRHTFAKMWILNMGDPFRLQQLLGHSDLDTVKEYMDLFSHDLHKDFDTLNPLEQMQKNIKRGKYIRIKGGRK